MNFDQFRALVEEWADVRDIYKLSTGSAQLFKAVEEIGELCGAEVKNDMNKKKDGIGDVIVCLINYAKMNGLTMEECFSVAWNEIKDRRGFMIEGGAFVKEV